MPACGRDSSTWAGTSRVARRMTTPGLFNNAEVAVATILPKPGTNSRLVYRQIYRSQRIFYHSPVPMDNRRLQAALLPAVSGLCLRAHRFLSGLPRMLAFQTSLDEGSDMEGGGRGSVSQPREGLRSLRPCHRPRGCDCLRGGTGPGHAGRSAVVPPSMRVAIAGVMLPRATCGVRP